MLAINLFTRVGLCSGRKQDQSNKFSDWRLPGFSRLERTSFKITLFLNENINNIHSLPLNPSGSSSTTLHGITVYLGKTSCQLFHQHLQAFSATQIENACWYPDACWLDVCLSTSWTRATKQAVTGKHIWKKKIILLPKGLKIASRYVRRQSKWYILLYRQDSKLFPEPPCHVYDNPD